MKQLILIPGVSGVRFSFHSLFTMPKHIPSFVFITEAPLDLVRTWISVFLFFATFWFMPLIWKTRQHYLRNNTAGHDRVSCKYENTKKLKTMNELFAGLTFKSLVYYFGRLLSLDSPVFWLNKTVYRKFRYMSTSISLLLTIYGTDLCIF